MKHATFPYDTIEVETGLYNATHDTVSKKERVNFHNVHWKRSEFADRKFAVPNLRGVPAKLN